MMHALCNAIVDVNIFRQAGSRLAITCQDGVGTDAILGAHSCRGTYAAGDVVRNPSKIYAVFGVRYYLETVRLGSIRRAAESMHVSPSAVCRQIALLVPRNS
jgi:hypothetical protein